MQINWTKSIHITIAILCFVIAFFGWLNFPSTSLLLPILIVFLSIHISKTPTAWLIWFIPIIATINLAPITGRFIFTEFDIITLAIIGALFIGHRNVAIMPPTKAAWVFITFLVLSIIVTPISWHSIFSPQTQNPYYDLAYGFKVLKGLIYALPLGYFFSIQMFNSKQQTIDKLGIGAAITAFAIFIIILWERHTLAAVIDYQSVAKILDSLLNLSTSYRATSLMADMHTGGESLDGLYLTLVAFNLFVFTHTHKKTIKILTLTGLIVVLYCIMVGFTRATYVSAFITIAALFTLKYVSSAKKFSIPSSILPCLTVISAIPLYNKAGYISAVSLLFILFAKELLNLLPDKFHKKQLLIPIYALASLLALYGHLTNIWVTPNVASITIVLTLSALLCLASWFYECRHFKQPNGLSIQSKTIIILVAVGFAIMFGGSRIQHRLETINKDIDTRLTHWSAVLESSGHNVTTKMFGNGWGSFPRNYVASYPELVEKVGSFTINDNALILGAGKDLAIGQRVTIFPQQAYTIDIKIQTSQDTPLSFMLCERNLIIFDRWAIKCSYLKHDFIGSANTQALSFELNSKKIGEGNILTRWPTVFIIRNYASKQPVIIDSVQLKDRFGHPILDNQDFTHGMDHWFFYHDFEHLPWHIKNIFFAIDYQLGFVGAILFALMIGLLIIEHLTANSTKEHSTLSLTLIAGILTFGFFGDPLDSARVSSLFFAVLFMSLCAYKKQPKVQPNL